MNWKGVLLALGLGAAGGTAFFLADLPLPWMLGSMSACIIAALAGAKPAMAMPLRSVMLAVLGVMLGSSFTPDLLDQAAQWAPSLVSLFVAMAVATIVVMAYLRRVGGMTVPTAYFAAAPGGVNEMVVTGGALGGDERTIAMIHFLRILLIVFTIPFGFQLATGIHGAPMGATMGRVVDLKLADAALLLACVAGGVLLGRVARFPAAPLTGPMTVSSLVHILGLTTSHPPAELVVAAQVVTGAGLGCRMVGLNWRHLAQAFRVALGSTMILIMISAGLAGLLAWQTPLPFSMLLLAFVPGGIAEMCLIALALGQDVAFVSTHHVLRVILVIACAPLAFRLFKPWFER
ncbi:MAG: AbrB family transcriptional regulator [Magnetospirillum sp.]|nr:AbrB family transcriptional regulator [Magnetospirillum sp.]